MSKRIKLYHGSPHRLDEIRPAVATGKGEASAREHAIYLANNPEEARLYALTRPRNNKRKGWAILDNKVHYVKDDPINKQGYVYEHEFDDYAAPPESDPGIGYRVYGAYKPVKRKRVRLRGIEDQFVEHPDKASYKAKVKEWLASREKISSYREGGSFTHEGTEYDLDHALSLADKQPVTSMRVKDLAWVLRHGKADPERVRRADLSAPLLVSHTSDGRPTVVDGFHRLTKANNDGAVSVPTRFVDRKELRKTSSVKHTLVTGHSGAGKSTLARSFGLPIHALDDDHDIREQLNRQMAYARANQGRLPTGKRYARAMQHAEDRAIARAMALKDPHVIEGSYLLNRDPEEFRAHNTHLVDTPEDVVLDRRVERQRVKDLARNRRWDDERAKGVRMRGQQLIDEYAPGVKRWRGADYVKKASFQSLSSMRREAKQNKYITRRRFLKHLIRETAELSTTEKSNYVKRLAKDVSGLPKLASKEGVATKTDPAKWARAKAQARAKMGGKHSARAMQLATQIYKKNGGGYSGAKPSSGTNKLKKWTKQKWQWSGKDTPGPGGTGVYLPKRSSEQLKSTRAGRDKLRAASAAKRAATNSGRQFSSHGLHVGKKRSDVR